MRNKKLIFLAITALLIVLLFLLPKSKSVSIPVFPDIPFEDKELSIEEFSEKIFQYENALEQYNQLAEFLFTSIELNNEQMTELAAIFTDYELLVNKKTILTSDTPVMIELNKYISEFVAHTSLPQIKKIYNQIIKENSYKKLNIISEHSLQRYEIDEDSKQSIMYYAEDSKSLRDFQPTILLELPIELLEELNIRGENPIQKITIYDGNYINNDVYYEHHYLEEYHRYQYLVSQVNMIQEAISNVMNLYPNSEELIAFINKYTSYSAYTDSLNGETKELNDYSEVSFLSTIAFVLENPFISVTTDEVIKSLISEFTELTQITQTHDNILNSNIELSNAAIIHYHFIALNDNEQQKFSMKEELQHKLLLLTNEIILKNTWNPNIYSTISKIDWFSYEELKEFLSFNISDEHTVFEAKKLIVDLLTDLPIEQQKEVVKQLILNDIRFNYTPLQDLLLPAWEENNYYIDEYKISIRQRISSLLLDVPNLYTLIEDELLEVEDLINIVDLPNIETFKPLLTNYKYYKEVMYFTKDLNHPFITDELALAVNPNFIDLEKENIILKNINYGSSSKAFLHNDILRQIKQITNYEIDEEISILRNAFLILLNYVPEEEIIDILNSKLVCEYFYMTANEEEISYTQPIHNKYSQVEMVMYIQNPLIPIFSEDFYMKYLEIIKGQIIKRDDLLNIADYSMMNYYNSTYINMKFIIRSKVIGAPYQLNFHPLVINNFNLPYDTLLFTD